MSIYRNFQNIGGTSGDLTKVWTSLTQQFGPDEAAKIVRSSSFPLILSSMAPAAAAAPVAAQGAAGLGGAVAAELIAAPIANALGSLLGKSAAPSEYRSAGGQGTSKYFFQPETYTNYAQWYATELPKIIAYNQTIGRLTGQELPVPPSPEEFARQSVERSEYQAQTFNQRLIEQERAKAEAEYRTRAMEAGYGLEGEKVKSLGDVQRQRISSGYSAMGSAVNSAIQNMFASGRLENSPVLTEVAKAF